MPVFVGYGTLDKAVVADDYLRLETIRLHKTNFTFRDYSGREHNFFGVKNGHWPAPRAPGRADVRGSARARHR